MKVLATIAKITDGRQSTWRFCEVDGTYCAIRDNSKLIRCRNIDDMRRLYKRMTTSEKYGFAKV